MNDTKTIRYEMEAPNLMAYFAETRPLLNSFEIDRRLLALIELRTSQINGCAFCIKLHEGEARKYGVSEQRIEALPRWRESAEYDEGEKAALAWAEALTTLDRETDYGPLRARLREHFSDRQITALTFDIGVGNLWNRVNISRH